MRLFSIYSIEFSRSFGQSNFFVSSIVHRSLCIRTNVAKNCHCYQTRKLSFSINPQPVRPGDTLWKNTENQKSYKFIKNK